MKAARSWPYARFKSSFYGHGGLDLDRYKDAQMERRIRQFMERYSLRCFGEFFSLLEADPAVDRAFRSFLTINTSGFFRDRAIYDQIQAEVLPALLREHHAIKIWSAPCSTGQEPYSIAILLDQRGQLGRARIVASDIDAAALEIARAGRYPERALGDLDSTLIRRYFTPGDGDTFELKPRLRHAVTFKQADLLRDTEPQNHLILCRNLLIYLKQETQGDLISRLVASLLPGGFLVVGGAENIPEAGRWGLGRAAHGVYRSRDR